MPWATAGLVYAATGAWRAELSFFEQSRLQASALFVTIATAVIVAPLAGVTAMATDRVGRSDAAAASVRRTWNIIWPLGLGLTILVLSSAVVGFVMVGARTALIPTLLASHATFWASTLALAMLGVCCASALLDPLDAAAAAIGVSVLATGGVLVLGPVLEGAPLPAINAALLLSPLVATASSGHIDILRSDFVYRFSPLAHMRVEYPEWRTAVSCFALLAFAGCCVVSRGLRRRDGRRLERMAL